MSQAISLNQSTWASKLKAMGPGILMATAAVGGSHIVSSTQAGGSYGWSLLLLVILANVFKYPFSVLVLNTQLILERLWLKVMPKRKTLSLDFLYSQCLFGYGQHGWCCHSVLSYHRQCLPNDWT